MEGVKAEDWAPRESNSSKEIKMNDQEVRRHVTQWIEDTLSKPSPNFNNLPPCPYSHSVLLKNKVDFRYASGAGLLQTLASIARPGTTPARS